MVTDSLSQSLISLNIVDERYSRVLPDFSMETSESVINDEKGSLFPECEPIYERNA
jgi:hypothetical protein